MAGRDGARVALASLYAERDQTIPQEDCELAARVWGLSHGAAYRNPTSSQTSRGAGPTWRRYSTLSAWNRRRDTLWSYGVDRGVFEDVKSNVYVKDMPLSRIPTGDVLLAYELNGDH